MEFNIALTIVLGFIVLVINNFIMLSIGYKRGRNHMHYDLDFARRTSTAVVIRIEGKPNQKVYILSAEELKQLYQDRH